MDVSTAAGIGGGAGGASAATNNASSFTEVNLKSPSSAAAVGGGGGGGGDDGAGGAGGMLSIVQAQRDRFMARINDLEREKSVLTRQVGQSRQTGQQLQRDNLKLYEKIRYLQSYGGGAGGGAGRGGGGASGHGGWTWGRCGGSSDMQVRYRSLYEQQTVPFTQFSRWRSAAEDAELSVAEKITLNTTRMFLSSKFARNFVFFFIACPLVFVLVFLPASTPASAPPAPAGPAAARRTGHACSRRAAQRAFAGGRGSPRRPRPDGAGTMKKTKLSSRFNAPGWSRLRWLYRAGARNGNGPRYVPRLYDTHAARARSMPTMGDSTSADPGLCAMSETNLE